MVNHSPTGIGRLRAVDRTGRHVNAVIEAVRGTRSKYKFDEATGLFVHDKALPAGLAYPLDFGFIPGTRAADGDPLDVLVLADEPAHVGAVVPARLIGAIEAEQSDGAAGAPIRNDRLLAVAAKSSDFNGIRTIRDVPRGLLDGIEAFFVASNALRGRTFEPVRRVGTSRAWRLLRDSAHEP